MKDDFIGKAELEYELGRLFKRMRTAALSNIVLNNARKSSIACEQLARAAEHELRLRESNSAILAVERQVKIAKQAYENALHRLLRIRGW